MKRRLMALILAGVMAVTVLAGCGKKSDDSSTKEDRDRQQRGYHRRA